MEHKNIQRFFVGSFNIAKGEGIMVTDPCYQGGDKEINNVKPGIWLCYVERVETDNGWGKRNITLSAVHETIANNIGVMSVPFGNIGVDSGQAGMYALRGWQENRPSEDDYDRVCVTTLSTTIHAGMVEYGVTSSSGFGDGGYELYGRIDDEQVVGLEVVFITQPGDPRNFEDDPDYEDED